LTTNKKYEVKIKAKKTALTVVKVEKDSVITSVDGWRIRLYFDKDLTKDKIESVKVGRQLEVEYTGNIKDVHSLKFSPLKEI
jgi:hypothetical protein